ncbi:MAG TPA: hypothetical protein VKU82_16085 [Planctomycetaceae bacterium]|nr:hypothetical protein [Planctomycetaceae bacterium]
MFRTLRESISRLPFLTRFRRRAQVLGATVYIAVLVASLVQGALGDPALFPIAYFFTWDMFPSYDSQSFRRIALGKTATGKYVRLQPSSLQQYRGGVHGDLTRVDIERRGLFYRSAVMQSLKSTFAIQEHDPVARIFLFEEYWPAKFNYPDDLYKHWSGDEKPDRRFWRLVDEFDVAAGAES